MADKLPIVAVTMGDPAGIGPEVIVKALMAGSPIHTVCRPVVIGDAGVIRRAAKASSMGAEVNAISSVSEACFHTQTINVLDTGGADLRQVQMGRVSAECGKAAFAAVRKAIGLALSGEVDATCTAPISKESINAAGYRYAGHTEIYAELTGTKEYAMLLVDEPFRIVHVTTHLQLRKACDMVRRERVLSTIRLGHAACMALGVDKPRVGVAALNPHAGEGGLFGWEEEKEIKPAVEEAVRLGMQVEGPVPADTLFAKAHSGIYDLCVAMYHDQGHIPLKLAGFRWAGRDGNVAQVSGVNITLGLPIIRTSVDHGTAFDIADKGIACDMSMRAAILCAARLAAGHSKA